MILGQRRFSESNDPKLSLKVDTSHNFETIIEKRILEASQILLL